MCGLDLIFPFECIDFARDRRSSDICVEAAESFASLNQFWFSFGFFVVFLVTAQALIYIPRRSWKHTGCASKTFSVKLARKRLGFVLDGSIACFSDWLLSSLAAGQCTGCFILTITIPTGTSGKLWQAVECSRFVKLWNCHFFRHLVFERNWFCYVYLFYCLFMFAAGIVFVKGVKRVSTSFMIARNVIVACIFSRTSGNCFRSWCSAWLAWNSQRTSCRP